MSDLKKRQFNIRASELLMKEIEALQEKFNMGKGEIVALAVDRLYQQEIGTDEMALLERAEAALKGAKL